jgi:hypothetical protein
MKASWLLLALLFQDDSKSAIERDPSGWVDLMPGRDFKGWKRVPIDPLAAKPVYSHSEDGKTLLVDGVAAKEILMEEEERGDGILHVEWRFKKIETPNPVYNGGIYFRTSMDAKQWVQAQVAHAEKGPVVGDLFGVIPIDGKDQRFEELQKAPTRSKPPGEWNTYEIVAKGKDLSLWVNGAVTSRYAGCTLPRGHLGIQAEFAAYEIRSFKYKPLP